MKKLQLAIVLLFCLIIILFLAFCTSLSETKLKENPDFVNNAKEYTMIHPLTQASGKTQTFTIEDVQTRSVYQIEMLWSKETDREGYITSLKNKPEYNGIDEDFIRKSGDISGTDINEMKKGDMAQIRDSVYHSVEIFNTIDSSEYIVLGKVEFFSQIEKESDRTSFETTNISFPIELWIFEEGKNAGKVTFDRSHSSSNMVLKIDIQLHDRLFNIEFQELFNKRKVSIEVDNRLIAFFDLKPASFISTKKKGNALIDTELSSEITADIFSSYILADIAIGMLKHE